MAFWPLYLARPFASIDRYTHLHAVAGTLWLVLLLAQPAAVHARRFALHRLLGRVSYGLAAAFAGASVLLSHHRLASMDSGTFAAEGFGHYLPFYATAIFVLAYVFGLWFRRFPTAHGRFMMCTAVPLVDPVLGRVMAFYLPPLPSPWLYQAVTFAVATVVAGLLVFTYRGSVAARRALVSFFAVLVLLQLGWFWIAPRAFWLEAVRWFRGIPLT
ncbi:MAG: hypothetical protein JNL48_14475 [Acidobacteria bacterium]|nr:hypothetical protein [Acidobacteriota bacterium]